MDTIGVGNIAWWEILLGGICTLAIYSFLYRENPFYRFFEHLYIGIAAGITIVIGFRQFMWPIVLSPLFGADRIPYPDGTYPDEYNVSYLFFLIPIGFGSLYYCILSRRYSWLAQLAIGLSLGMGAGIAFEGVINLMLPQIFDSFKPLYVVSDGAFDLSLSLGNLIFVLTLFITLSFFFFTFRRKEGGAIERSGTLGRWLMMGCFGAFFGSTISARMALLIERLEFLIKTWLPTIFS